MSQAVKVRQSLGKGFDALISDDFDKSILLESGEKVEKVPIDNVKPNPDQPRKHFDEEALKELASSIKEHGIIQPLVVTPTKNGEYIIVAGERRWRAAAKANLSTVPVISRSTKALEQLEIALIENVQRVDLNPLEQAASIQRLVEQFSLPFETITKRLGKADSTLRNIVRLLQLPDDAKTALTEGKITEGHARQILALIGDPERQAYLLKSIIEHKWNVRQAERFVTSIKEGIKESDKASARTQTETQETRDLSKKLGTPVHIRRMASGGKLEITFGSDEELSKIINLFG